MKAKSRDFDVVAEIRIKEISRGSLESENDKERFEDSIDRLDYCSREDLARKLRIRTVSNGGGL